MLQQSLAVRFQYIIRNSQIHKSRDLREFQEKLADDELEIFKLKMDAQYNYRKWKDRDTTKLMMSSLVGSKKQRTA